MRKTITAIVGAAATTLLVSGAGLMAANASPASSTATANEHFYLMTTSPTASKYVLIATGAFTAGGTDISGSKTDLVKLPGGGFKIHHGGALHVITENIDQATCLAHFKGTVDFTVGNGTGKYAGISGSGKATVIELAIFKRTKGACNPNAAAVVNEQTITAAAHVKV